jgi:hypothetical protein
MRVGDGMNAKALVQQLRGLAAEAPKTAVETVCYGLAIFPATATSEIR